MRQKCLPIIVLSPLNSPLLLRHHQNSGALYDDCAKGDFDRLRSSFQAANLSNAISSGNLDIDRDWHSWKDTFLEGVADCILKKKLKGKNPVPWINGPILTLIKKKEPMRKKLVSSPSSYLNAKFKDLRSEVKRMLREARDSFLSGM